MTKKRRACLLLVNFASQTISDEVLSALATLTGVTVGEIRQVTVSARLPPGDFEVGVAQLVDAIEATQEQLQSSPMIVIPPESSEVACGVLAVLHGRMGHFPGLLHWSDGGSIEVVNLQLIRSLALDRRYADL